MAHKLRTDVILADRDMNELFSDKLRFIFIELPSFTKEEADCFRLSGMGVFASPHSFELDIVTFIGLYPASIC